MDKPVKKLVNSNRFTGNICEGSQVVKGAALRALSCRGSGVRILALANKSFL